MDLLAKAFTYGKSKKVSNLLATDCVLISEHENIKKVTSSEAIKEINKVYSEVTDSTKHSYKIVVLEDVSNDLAYVNEMDGCYLNGYGLLLNRFGNGCCSVVVSVIQEENSGKIKQIILTHNKESDDNRLCEYEGKKSSKLNKTNDTSKAVTNRKKGNTCTRRLNGWNGERNWTLHGEWKRNNDGAPIKESLFDNSWCLRRKVNSGWSRFSLTKY